MVLTHHAYCGMEIPLIESDRATCRGFAANRLSLLRSEGYPVTVLTRGRQWEVGEPDSVHLVPDACGVLTLEDDPAYERTCGFCEGEFTTDDRTRVYCCLACEDHAGGWLCGQAECDLCAGKEEE